MGSAKKAVRQRFRDGVFLRDAHRCRVCGTGEDAGKLDAHHITARTEMPNGGYVTENGIAVCQECHFKAEVSQWPGQELPGYSREELYHLIGSSYKEALAASRLL